MALVNGSGSLTPIRSSPSADFTALKTLIEASIALSQPNDNTGHPPQKFHDKIEELIGDPKFDTDASIVLIGMRGVGKTTLGLMLATYLNRPFIDADRVYEHVFATPIRQAIMSQGWDIFRQREALILEQLLSSKGRGRVIVLGGGVVETESNRQLLREWALQGKPIVHISRKLEDVLDYMRKKETKSTWGAFEQGAREIWHHRMVWYEQCSNLSFVTLSPTPGMHLALALKHVEPSLQRMARIISDEPEYSKPFRVTWNSPRLRCLTLNGKDVALSNASELEMVSRGADLIELRVDSFQRPSLPTATSQPSTLDFYEASLAMGFLRQRSPLPLIYAVRTTSQGGSFDGSRAEYICLLETGFRLMSDFVEISMELSDAEIERLMRLRRSQTQVILCWAWTEPGMSWTDSEVLDTYRRAVRLGASLARLSFPSDSLTTPFQIPALQDRLEVESSVPLIAINSGAGGTMSRVLNRAITFISHPRLLDQSADTISCRDLLATLRLTQLEPAQVIADYTGQQGVVSLLRAAVKEACVNFDVMAAADSGGLVPLISRSTFGGALISESTSHIPPSATLSLSARAIGFVDTILPQPLRSRQASPKPVLWDNIRSRALAVSISRCLSPANLIGRWSSAAVSGASGRLGLEVIWALKELGVKTLYVTKCSKDVLPLFSYSEDMFNGMGRPVTEVIQLPSLAKLASCPANRVPTIVIYFPQSTPSSEQMLPTEIVESSTGGVIMDLASSSSTLPIYEGWIQISRSEVEREFLREQFRSLTSKGFPANLL